MKKKEITPHINNQKDLKLHEKRKLIDINTEMTEMLELFDKDFKTTMIKMLQVITSILETKKQKVSPKMQKL